MRKRTFFTVALCLVVCFILAFSDLTSVAAVLTFETQYEYESANTAWLTDLIIKEDMSTVSGMSESAVLVPQTNYPYVETPTSFKNDVNNYCTLYSFDKDAQRSAYIYLLDLLGTNSEVLADGITNDDEIKEYLEYVGVVYPEFVNADELIIAKSLYAALITGTLSLSDINTESGIVTLENALVTYVSQVTGMDLKQLSSWLPSGEIRTLNDYVLAAAKLSLWSNGYEVTSFTSDEDVYKMIAVMTLEQMGIAVSSDVTFEELQLQYTAAMLGTVYEVSIDCNKLADAIKNDNVAFYILQLLGQKANLSIREDNCSYLEAFYLVAENTGLFDMEEDEFYADVERYSVSLKNLRESIWLYPTAYSTGNDDYSVKITVNGVEIRNNYFNEVFLNTSVSEQTLELTVTSVSSSGESSAYTYYIEVYQGENPPESETSENNTAEDTTFSSSDSIVSQVLNSLGLNVSIESMINSFYSSLSPSVTGVVALIAPTFGNNATVNTPESETQTETVPEVDFISILDKIGAVIDTQISGISGIYIYDNYSAGDEITNFVTFD